jgi:ATP adenylyltransferase
MKKIWAPWRSKFIYNRKRKGCIFCKAANAKKPKDCFVLEKTRSSFMMLNTFPYNNGHIMVSPKAHMASLTDLSANELTDLMLLLNRAIRLLDKTLKPHGYNIGINLGKTAGAGYPGHVHIHLVPRWEGDTNFMPIFSETKIMSESLNSLYKRLMNYE